MGVDADICDSGGWQGVPFPDVQDAYLMDANVQ